MLELIPNGTRVFVVLDAVQERKTAGGIYLPDKHAEQSRIGTVKWVGPGAKEAFKPGDRVFVSFYTGVGVDYPGLEGFHYDTHRFMEATEILGTITKEDGAVE